ncbi:MAG TPA: hypothetical protein VJL37_03465 [Flavobacterium sp.]|nr:hypothetical protein [Flavobacterium sp.]
MQLKLKIHTKTLYPKRGVFIRSASLEYWMSEIDRMGLSLDKIQVFPVAGTVANQLFGALVVLNEQQQISDLEKNSYFQLVEDKVFIPERTILVPEMNAEEFSTVFSANYHLMHPEIGLCELEEAIDWLSVLRLPEMKECPIIQPLNSVKIPKLITSLQVDVDQKALQKSIENPLTEQELIDNLPFNIKKIMAGNEKEIDKLLAYLEKHPEKALQLGIPLDAIGSSRGGNGGRFVFGGGFSSDSIKRTAIGILEKTAWIIANYGVIRFILIIAFVTSLRSCSMDNIGEGLGHYLGFLSLMILAGLLYVFVFDKSNYNARFSSGGGGSALINTDRFNALHERYEKLAEDYLAKGDYRMASHIYFKLLKNTYRAASILEDGGFYNEAAIMQLKYNNNKFRAAECYVKGHAYREALELYKQLNEHEKAGDVCVKMGNRVEANKNYQLVVDNHLSANKYIKAALLYKDKMLLINETRETLLKGWAEQKEAVNCMSMYFSTFDQIEELASEIKKVYAERLDQDSSVAFLQVMKGEFKKHIDLEEITREIAYQIVSEKINNHPQLASELVPFNANNKSIIKDVIRFKQNRKKK